MLSALSGDSTPAASTPSAAPDLANFVMPEPPAPGAQPAPVPAPTTAPAASTPPSKPSLAKALSARKLDRDLTGIPEDKRALFEQMSNEAFLELAPAYREYLNLSPHKDKLSKLPELEKERDEALKTRWADHPESYTLTEDYRKSMASLSRVSEIEAVFEEAMVTIQDPAARTVEIVAKENGELVRKAVPITPEVRRQVMFEYNGAKEAKNRLTKELESVKTKHGESHRSYVSGIENFHEKLFGEHKQLLGDKPLEHLKQFPAALRAKPEGKLLASALTLLDMAAEALTNMQQKSAATTAHGAAVADAPPGRETMLPTTAKPKGMYSKEEYERARQMGYIP